MKCICSFIKHTHSTVASSSMMTAFFLLPAALLLSAAAAEVLTLKPNCQASCGGIDIPYPFGIGNDCFRDGFEVSCVNNKTKLKGTITDIEVLELSVMPLPEVRVTLPVAYQCYNAETGGDGAAKSDNTGRVNIQDISTHRPYRISDKRNKLVVLGCNTFVYTNSGPWNRSLYSFYSGCVAYCDNPDSPQNGACAGIGCCEAAIPPGLTDNKMTFHNDGSFL